MSQKEDLNFAELLCRVRKASCTNENLDTLKASVVHDTCPDYPEDALHVYQLNKDVDEKNITTLLQQVTMSSLLPLTIQRQEY